MSKITDREMKRNCFKLSSGYTITNAIGDFD